MPNAIVTENQNTGTTAWRGTLGATTQIQAYLDAQSYNVGDTVTMFVSTQVAGTAYSYAIYRLGYYQDTGGCLKLTQSGFTGQAQGYWDQSGGTLNNCPTAVIDGTTNRVEAGWASTGNFVIPSNWITGCYLIIYTD